MKRGSWLPLFLALLFAHCGEQTETSAPASEARPTATEVAPPPVPALPPPAPPSVDRSSKLAIVCYHQFTTNRLERGEMRIFMDDFRKQMQALKDLRIPVVSMSDFLAWRRGEKAIPRFSVVITIDDGYVSTYDLAMPVLKEYSYPFTIYLYTKFLASGGKTMKVEQVKELLASGGELGSHSVSHKDLRAKGRLNAENYEAWLQEEIADSRRILREKIGVDPVTFAFPFGAFNERCIEIGKAAGYQAMFTVAGRKIGWDTDLDKVGRYAVSGVNEKVFQLALAGQVPGGGLLQVNEIHPGDTAQSGTSEPNGQALNVSVSPEDGALIKERQPRISVDLSKIENLDPSKIRMTISGVGQVTAKYDEASKQVTYQPTQRLRLPEYSVHLSFQRNGEPRPDSLRWTFQVDGSGDYAPADGKELPVEAAKQTAKASNP